MDIQKFIADVKASPEAAAAAAEALAGRVHETIDLAGKFSSFSTILISEFMLDYLNVLK